MINAMKAFRSCRDVTIRPSRRRNRPAVEAMEPRTLLAFNFTSVIGFGGDGIIAQKPAVDSAGNVYVTGMFTGQVAFDPESGGGVVGSSSTSTNNIFVAKYSPYGALDWVQPFYTVQGSGLDSGTSVAVDNNGNVFVTGLFSGTVNFSTTSVEDNVAATDDEVFVMKLSAQNGSLEEPATTYGPAAGAGGFDEPSQIQVWNPSGSSNPSDEEVVLTGQFESSLKFYGNGGSSTTLDQHSTGAYASDAFVADLDGDLNFQWAYDLATGATAIGTGVAFDPSGDVYLVGTFSGTGSFDPAFANEDVITSKGEQEYVEEFRPDGTSATFLAAGAFGSVPTYPLADFVETPTIAVDSSGNAYVTGMFEGQTVNFNPQPGEYPTSASYMNSLGDAANAFVVKLNSSLAWQTGLSWDIQIGGSAPYTGGSITDLEDLSSGIALDQAGNVYVAGVMTTAATIQGTNPGATTLNSAAVSDPDSVFVTELNGNGNLVADQVAGGAGFDWAFGLASSADGQVAVVGDYSQPSTFGSFNTKLNGTLSYFIADLSNSTSSPSPTPTPTSPSSTPTATSPSPTPIATSPSPTPVLTGDQPMFSGKGKNRKITSAQLFFSGALDFGTAQNTGNYRVTQRINRKKTRVVSVLAATYNPGNNSVTLILGKSQKAAAMQVVITGLRSTGESPLSESVISL